MKIIFCKIENKLEDEIFNELLKKVSFEKRVYVLWTVKLVKTVSESNLHPQFVEFEIIEHLPKYVDVLLISLGIPPK